MYIHVSDILSTCLLIFSTVSLQKVSKQILSGGRKEEKKEEMKKTKNEKSE